MNPILKKLMFKGQSPVLLVNSLKGDKGVDINRDTGGARVGSHGFQGVSMVAIDDDWAALRFKRAD
jgi:hypothetical protein